MVIPVVITGAEDVTGSATPLAALIRFYRAFNRQDMAQMADNWLPTAEVSMSNPLGGIRRGWPDIRAGYERIFHGPARVYVEFHDFTLHIGKDLFCAAGRERGYLRTNATDIPLAIRTTRIFRHVGGDWRQLHHHGSIDDPALLANYQSTVSRT